MASALLASRQLPSCLVTKRQSARSGAFRSRPAPFTPARRVFARAQEAEDVAVSNEEAAQVVVEDVADEDLVLDYSDGVASEGFKDPADEGEAFVVDSDDEDLLAGLEAAALLDDVDVETVAAVGVELDEDEEDRTDSASALESALAQKLESSYEVSKDEVAEILSGLGDSADLVEVELVDRVPASNSDRYAEVPLSAEDKEALEPYKLSKSELRALLPADWDQINIDFFSQKKDESIPLPDFRLNVLWKDTAYLGVAIDQIYARGQVSPLTEYFFWPRQDAWEELRMNLEARPWISERDRIVLLNRLTQLINFWQDEQLRHTIEEARAEFPDCAFTVA